jgi:hypothetical protein
MTITAEFIKGAAAQVVGKLAGAAAESALKRVTAKRPKRSRRTRNRTGEALVEPRTSRQHDPALDDFRENLFAELRKLIKPAIAQAKKGKPAMLHILTHYTR